MCLTHSGSSRSSSALTSASRWTSGSFWSAQSSFAPRLPPPRATENLACACWSFVYSYRSNPHSSDPRQLYLFTFLHYKHLQYQYIPKSINSLFCPLSNYTTSAPRLVLSNTIYILANVTALTGHLNLMQDQDRELAFVGSIGTFAKSLDSRNKLTINCY